MIVIVTRFKWCQGRNVYEIPIKRHVIKARFNATYFYTPDRSRCFVAVAPGTGGDNYYKVRQYANFVGIAQYQPSGVGQFEVEGI